MMETPHRKRNRTGSRHRHEPRKSASRENDRSSRRRHKSRKRRHRHSRSRSGTVEKRPPVVYMNPAFQSAYSNSLSHSDNELRTTLVNQLSASEQRISSLESELRAAQLARGRAEQTVFEVNSEKLRLESHNAEIIQVMKTLERAVEELQNAYNAMKNETERRRRETESAEKNLTQCKEQTVFLSDRNMKLVRKCEELSEENKAILSRRDESARELAEVRPRIEGLQAELRQRAEENRKMVAQMRSYEEKERLWKKEKVDFEKRIEIKDAMAAAERRNNDEWKKRHLAEKAELERKVQLVEPEIRKALEAEAIMKAIQDLRTYYEKKVDEVMNEVESLKNNSISDQLQINNGFDKSYLNKKNILNEHRRRASSIPPNCENLMS